MPEPARGGRRRSSTGSAPRRRAPAFYRGLSSRTYFDRITEPVLIHHGAVDGTCPPRWSRTTQRLLEQAGVDSTLVEYPGEDHAFYARWQDSIERTRALPPAPARRVTGRDAPSPPGATLATTEHPGGDMARSDLQTRRLDAVRAWTSFVEHGDEAGRPGPPGDPDQLDPLRGGDPARRHRGAAGRRGRDRRRTGRARRSRRPSSGSRPSCGAPPRTATWSSRSPTPRPASSGRTAAG